MDGYMGHVADRSSVSGNDSKLPGFEGSDSWNNETAHEYLVNQGPFYPATSAYYGYYHTGFETPADWDEQPKVLGFDSQVLQYPASPTESVPYMYYSPNYDYRRSAYNPYNPYIPGAIISVEGPFGGSPPYYDDLMYQQSVSSPAYSPISNRTRSEVASSSFTDISNLDTFSYMGEHGMLAEKNFRVPPILREKSSNIYHNKPSFGSRSKSPQTSHISESIQGTDGTTKQSPSMGLDSSFGFPSLRTSYISQVPTPSTSSMRMTGSTFEVSSVGSTPKFSAPTAHGFTGIGSKSSAWSTADKPNLRFQVALKGNLNQDGTPEQNRGPRKNKLTSPISLKAYTTLHDCSNFQGDIYIHPDQYNRDDFQIIHSDAKFFVIKSYSEDDVHKSIKYSVWSSTPNGNKRLEAAFEDAKRRSVGKPQCPVFLFFSVNASGQFCGVAEMVGPVDFHNDMDFWQQDKWTGSFPVKWHIIKDVPNTSFRRIILENNENKSVTNSRDTQEVPYAQGIEMLHIFKNYVFRTSILDDFVFYEERQKAIFEKRSRIRSNGYQFFPKMTVNDKQTAVIDEQSSSVETPPSINDSRTCAEISVLCASSDLKNNVADSRSASSLKISDLSIDGVSENANYKNGFDDGKEIHENAEKVEAFTVGTMTIRISGFDNRCSGFKNNGLNDTSSFITVGTISIDPKVGLNMGNFARKPSS